MTKNSLDSSKSRSAVRGIY